jgi:putative transposase
MQSGHVESFIGRLRDECLNARWSRTLADAREKISRWREEYNSERPPAVWAIARPTSSPKR